MYISVFTDELKIDDVAEALDVIRGWSVEHVDLRKRFFGKEFLDLTTDEMKRVRALLDERGLRVAVLESSLGKCHLPDAEGMKREWEKLEGILRAAEIFDCRLLRSYNCWQPKDEERGRLHELPERLDQVLSLFGPLAERAWSEGLAIALENCAVRNHEIRAVVERLNVPGWGMAWDVLNGWFADREIREKDEEGYIRQAAREALMIHVKAKGAVKVNQDVELIPYQRVLELAREEGFDGPVCIETHNPDAEDVGDVEQTYNVLNRVRHAWPAAALA
jgi:sugar phosphate isomerase/epimerase